MSQTRSSGSTKTGGSVKLSGVFKNEWVSDVKLSHADVEQLDTVSDNVGVTVLRCVVTREPSGQVACSCVSCTAWRVQNDGGSQ